MIDDDTYYIDILTQSTQPRPCVVDAAIADGDRGDREITEAVVAIERLLRA